VFWLGDEHVGAFLRERGGAARIGGLDLGAILGAAPLNVDVASTVAQQQSATVSAVIRRGGSTEGRDLT